MLGDHHKQVQGHNVVADATRRWVLEVRTRADGPNAVGEGAPAQ
jgi:hypothetical protein